MSPWQDFKDSKNQQTCDQSPAAQCNRLRKLQLSKISDDNKSQIQADHKLSKHFLRSKRLWDWQKAEMSRRWKKHAKLPYSILWNFESRLIFFCATSARKITIFNYRRRDVTWRVCREGVFENDKCVDYLLRSERFVCKFWNWKLNTRLKFKFKREFFLCWLPHSKYLWHIR